MAKKKTTQKRKPRTKKLVPSKDPMFVIDDDEQPKLAFQVYRGGAVIGSVEDYDYVLHRMILEAQRDAINEGKEGSEYVPYYTEMLNEKYGVQLTERGAYKIALAVVDIMSDLKKNTDG